MRAPEARAKIWNILQESSIFSHLEEKVAQIVDLFARLGGGVLEHRQHPPLATGLNLHITLKWGLNLARNNLSSRE